MNRLLPADQLEREVREPAATIAANAPLSVRAAKIAIRSHAAPEGLDAAREAITACVNSADAPEGQCAFLAKRDPRFEGR